MLLILLIIFIAYGLGCVATGYYLVRWRTGDDIRTLGTGTTGAFNVMRRLGASGFLLTSAGDLLKGVIAVALARFLGADTTGQLLALMAVAIGHNFPVQLRWSGGNGLATLTGALLIFDVGLWLLLLAVFAATVILIIVLRVFRLPVQVYTPAKVTVLCVPLAAWVMQRPPWVMVGLTFIVVIIMATIARNFRRLACLPANAL